MTPFSVELPFRPPLDPSNLYGHLVATAVPGVEEWRDGRFRAAVRLRHGPAILEVGLPVGSVVPALLHLADAADLDEATARCRQMLDLDSDPDAAAAVLSADRVLAPLVEAAPGRRVPGSSDAAGMAIRAVLGQQVSTAAARTHAARLVEAFGERIEDPVGGLTRLFPTPAAIVAGTDRLPEVARFPATRRATLLTLATALDDGSVDLDASIHDVRAALAVLPGIGPWTIDTVAMRALGDQDAFLPGDLGIRFAAERLGLPTRAAELERRSHAWSPHRSLAVQYLWATGEHAVNRLPAEKRGDFGRSGPPGTGPLAAGSDATRSGGSAVPPGTGSADPDRDPG
jgi:AraC family transcriptional regulator of adaptative response / DNA-3-methyladenine glycosylase II